MSDFMRSKVRGMAVAAALGALPLAWAWAVSNPQGPATRPAAAPATQPAPDPPPAANPHWTATGCTYCHDAAAGEPRSIPHERVDGICLQCHDGRRARAERHPVGRLFAREHIVRPEGWPAPEGRISCVTCHDILAGCHVKAQPPAGNPAFLRGEAPLDLARFCASCHTDTERHGLHNPHIMLSGEGQIIETSCRFCHQRPFEPAELEKRTGQPALNTDAITLCLGCHGTHREWFTPGHIGTRVTVEMKQQMRVDLLPLVEGDVIVCATCHNPHQRGVFPAGSPLEAGAITFPRQDEHLLRGFGRSLCSACHSQ